ncbi:MAG: hypothetical protein LAO55_07705 [Acidobacteriia bacterium]|nr:hypothetical protein [Terriglobia bacterium]
MPSHPTLTDLLERARRRLFGQLVLDKGALALLIGMGGAILLLITGTQILDWYWPVLLVAVSLGVGIYRLRKSLPSLYKLAQQIDRRLGLADSLSTAVHFAAHPEPGREAVSACQRRDAELVAQRVDVREALPTSRSRYLLPAVGLALVAFGLFAVRYAVTGSLSLEPSLLKIAYDSFFGPPPQQLAKNQAKRLNMTQDPFDPGKPDAQSTAADQQPEDLLNSQDSNDAVNPQGDDNAKQAADKEGDQNGGDADKQGKDQGDKDGKQSDKGDKGSKDGKDKEGGNQDKQGNNPSEGGVLDKIKDALANMLNKMKPNSAQQQQQQNGKSQPNDKGEKADKGEKQQDSQNAGAEPNPDSNQSGDQKNSDDAKSSSQPGKPSSQESASGAGSKDGEKAAKDAKALEAMGQISEILGKRSATVTGEMMVEVGQTKQSLKTPWTDKQANHAESGGEIHRDEVPLIFQPFVERYFEEIRKTPQAAKPAPAASKSNKKAG